MFLKKYDLQTMSVKRKILYDFIEKQRKSLHEYYFFILLQRPTKYSKAEYTAHHYDADRDHRVVWRKHCRFMR